MTGVHTCALPIYKEHDFLPLFENDKNAIWKIIRIQSCFRSYLARKKFKLLKNCIKDNNPDPKLIKIDTIDPRVKEVEAKLGDYDPGPEPPNLGKKEIRPQVKLENNNIYSGEW